MNLLEFLKSNSDAVKLTRLSEPLTCEFNGLESTNTYPCSEIKINGLDLTAVKDFLNLDYYNGFPIKDNIGVPNIDTQFRCHDIILYESLDSIRAKIALGIYIKPTLFEELPF
jgi:hypothetical protein